MPGQIPFIGREEELSRIDEAIGQGGRRMVLFINGPGGIGKTRLLDEVYRKYVETEGTILVSEIIDFDDRALHLAENVERRLARRLDENAFKPYLQGLLDWHKMEAAGVSIELLEQQRQQVQQTLIRNLKEVSAKRRPVLLLDTIDKFENEAIWKRLAGIMLAAQNSVFILAGRRADSYYKRFRSEIGEDAVLIDLEPLSQESGREYLEKKQDEMHITLEPELADKLVVLSQGRPILIDLAVEWLSHDIPLDWMTTSSTEELKSISEAELSRHQAEFEIQLVQHLTQMRKPIDRLTLLMARVYPLSEEMIANLLNSSEEDAHSLFEEALTYVFVKKLPDGRISLHDEMRRMVREHVWPEVDATDERRRSQSELAAKYLRQKTETLDNRLQELEAARELAQEQNDVQGELVAFTSQQTTERELWSAKEQLLFHTLYNDTEEGVHSFATMFDEATAAYRFSVRELLLGQMQRQMSQLTPGQQYEVENRRVKFLLDCGNYGEADPLATKILESDVIKPEQNVDTLIQRANIRIRLGNIQSGIADFETAVHISQINGLQEWLARALNGRGWAHRLQGQLDDALEDYLQAYQISIQLGDNKRLAWILNNMGYVNAFKGNLQAALDNCQAALSLWEEIDFGRGMGATHSNLGEIYRRFDQLSEAMVHYNKALSIFIGENDIEWISTVQCGRASVLRLQNELDKAEKDLNEAQATSAKNLLPRILYERAKIHLARGNLQEAADFLQESEQVSHEIGDNHHDYRSFVDNLDLIWELGRHHKWRDLDAHYQKRYASREGVESYRLHGSYHRKLGDLAICNGDYDEALAAYQKGFILIATYEVHRPYTVGAQLKKTDMHLHRCDKGTQQLAQLGNDMMKFWNRREELVTKFPEALILFQRWQRKGVS